MREHLDWSTAAPEHHALCEQIRALNDRKEALALRAEPLMKQLRAKGIFASGLVYAKDAGAQPAPMSARERRAREMLGSHAPDPVAPPELTSDPVSVELSAIDEELATVQAALDMILLPPPSGGRSVWERSLISASRRYCDLVSPAYSEVCRRYVAALVELGESINQHAAFAEKLRGLGVLWAGLKPMKIVLPPPHDRGGPLFSAVDWAIECGHIPPETMPVHWRKPTPEVKKAAELQQANGFNVV